MPSHFLCFLSGSYYNGAEVHLGQLLFSLELFRLPIFQPKAKLVVLLFLLVLVLVIGSLELVEGLEEELGVGVVFDVLGLSFDFRLARDEVSEALLLLGEEAVNLGLVSLGLVRLLNDNRVEDALALELFDFFDAFIH